MSKHKSQSPNEASESTIQADRMGSRNLTIVLAISGVIISIFLAGWWFSNRPQSLDEPDDESEIARIDGATTSRPTNPEVPTPAIDPRKRRIPLPGFEKIEPAFSPELSDDLKTIVFAGGHPKAGYDLFIATREDVNSPFGTPKHIVSCSSRETDAYPTMTADGLELFFMRSDKAPQLLRTTRTSLAESFGLPEPVSLGTFDGEKMNVNIPQLATDLNLVFLVRTETAPGWQVMQAVRQSREAPFQTPELIPFTDPTPPYRLSNDLTRAYFGWPKGIWMASRKSLSESFDVSHPEINVAVTGEIEGPIFVGPREEFFIFCGPDLGKELGKSRKLWMVQH